MTPLSNATTRVWRPQNMFSPCNIMNVKSQETETQWLSFVVVYRICFPVIVLFINQSASFLVWIVVYWFIMSWSCIACYVVLVLFLFLSSHSHIYGGEFLIIHITSSYFHNEKNNEIPWSKRVNLDIVYHLSKCRVKYIHGCKCNNVRRTIVNV